jgi:hypothetical protein
MINHGLPHSTYCVISIRTIIAKQTAEANNWCLIHIVTLWIIPCARTPLHHPQLQTQILFTKREREREREGMRYRTVHRQQRAVRAGTAHTGHRTTLQHLLHITWITFSISDFLPPFYLCICCFIFFMYLFIPSCLLPFFSHSVSLYSFPFSWFPLWQKLLGQGY